MVSSPEAMDMHTQMNFIKYWVAHRKLTRADLILHFFDIYESIIFFILDIYKEIKFFTFIMSIHFSIYLTVNGYIDSNV